MLPEDEQCKVEAVSFIAVADFFCGEPDDPVQPWNSSPETRCVLRGFPGIEAVEDFRTKTRVTFKYESPEIASKNLQVDLMWVRRYLEKKVENNG